VYKSVAPVRKGWRLKFFSTVRLNSSLSVAPQSLWLESWYKSVVPVLKNYSSSPLASKCSFVRGSSPCCVMHAVIDFIDCYFDDDPVPPSSSSSTSPGVDTFSVKTTDHILTNGTALSCVSSTKSTWRSRASTISAYRASYCWSRDSVNGDTSLQDDDSEGGNVDSINAFNSDESRRRIYVVCPKCILMRNPSSPGRDSASG